MTARTILMSASLLLILSACVSSDAAQPVQDKDSGVVSAEAQSLRAMVPSDDGCVIVPRPKANAHPWEMVIEATKEGNGTKKFRLEGERAIWISGGSNSSEYELRLGEEYELTLDPWNGLVKASVQERNSARAPWESNLQREAHSLSRRPPVAVRPTGLEIDDVDFYWNSYVASLRFKTDE